ncbi:hypothetical protein JTE90_004065 [Oedothorax gibbosus]|uniref:Transposase n=1 Tax=Oedothorax gibbosus TaxID=931172 RepID=A0AAV6U5C4_9ARAC|nr:hypothetical protein JTE90_004065 [Oedothorax gibbosus]
MGRRTERHNAIVERIHKATRRDWKTFSKNQDPKNDAVLKKFTNKKYAKLLRKLCVSDAISHSRKIFQKQVIGYIPSDRQLRDRAASRSETNPDDIQDFGSSTQE